MNTKLTCLGFAALAAAVSLIRIGVDPIDAVDTSLAWRAKRAKDLNSWSGKVPDLAGRVRTAQTRPAAKAKYRKRAA